MKPVTTEQAWGWRVKGNGTRQGQNKDAHTQKAQLQLCSAEKRKVARNDVERHDNMCIHQLYTAFSSALTLERVPLRGDDVAAPRMVGHVVRYCGGHAEELCTAEGAGPRGNWCRFAQGRQQGVRV